MSNPDSPPRWSERRIGTADLGVTVHELDSGRPGPVLLVLGGVHGNEVGGIVAAARVASTDWPIARGKLIVVPVAHEAAFAANTRVSPTDGGNLARSFPGSPLGTDTERLAALIDAELIAVADALIDLHTSSPHTDMPLFVGCVDDGTAQSLRAVRLAAGFGIDTVWTHPELGPGRTLTAAHDRGIPALYVESPHGGVLNAGYLDAYVSGVQSVLEGLGLVDDGHARPSPRLWLHGNGDVDTFTAAPLGGLFLREVSLMDQVRSGQIVGVVLGLAGETLAEIASPADGYVTTLQRAAVVETATPLVGVTSVRNEPIDLVVDNRAARAGSK